MHGVGTSGCQCVEQRLNAQVALISTGRAQNVNFISHTCGLGIDVHITAREGNGNSQLFGGADNSHGDLTTIGDQ